MIRNINESEKSAALTTADIMAAAARTAPKANGLDKIMTLIIRTQALYGQIAGRICYDRDRKSVV